MNAVVKRFMCILAVVIAIFGYADNRNRFDWHTTSDGWVWRYTDTEEEDTFFDETSDGVRHCNGSAEIVEYVGEGGNVVMPSHVAYSDDEWDCKAVIRGVQHLTYSHLTGNNTFEGYRQRVTGLVIADTVKWIGKQAFFHCGQVETITVTSNSVLEVLGMNCFCSCPKLRSLTLNSTNLYAVSWDIVDTCTNLQEVTIEGDGKLNIESGMFTGCTALRKVHLGPGVRTVKYTDGMQWRRSYPANLNPSYSLSERWPCGGAFEGCSQLVDINLDRIEIVDSDAFKDCTSLTNVTLSATATSIGSSAFRGCTSLVSVDMPDTITYIGGNAFDGCASLTFAPIPKQVIDIGGEAFKNCSSLKAISLPEQLKSLGPFAFYNCIGVTNENVTIPNDIEYIGVSCFSGSSVYGITLPAREGITLRELFTDRGGWDWDVPVKSVEVTAGDGVIADNFARCYSSKFSENNVHLTNVTIHAGIRKIGAGAFEGCSAIKEIILPDSVVEIGESAFSGNSSVRQFRMPESVRNVANGTFYACTSLTEIVLSTAVTNVDSSAFNGCSSLRKISMPQTIVSIGWRAFSGCSSLKEIDLPEALQTVDDYAFNNCTSLTNLVFKQNVRYIGYDALFRCESLETLKFQSDNLRFYLEIGQSGPLSNCRALKSIIFEGNRAPTASGYYWNSLFNSVPSDLVIYVKPGSTGWDDVAGSEKLPEMWPNIFNYSYWYTDNRRITFIPMTLSFDTQGGKETIDAMSRTPREELGGLATPTRDGYTFCGWSREATDGEIMTATSLVPDESTTLYAQWVASEWTYSEVNGGVVVGNGTESAVTPALSGAVELPRYLGSRVVTRIADGAFADFSELTAVTVPSVDLGAGLFANCSALKRIVFEEDAPTNCSPAFLSGTPTDAVVYVKAGTKGWDGDWTSDALPVSGIWPEGANGRRISYDYVNITFDAGVGTVDVPQSALIARSPYGTLPVPTWAGHTFVGWFTKAEGGNLITPETVVPDDDTIVYAHWVEGVWTYSVVADEVTIGNGVDSAVTPLPTGDLVIPKWLGGLPVTALAASAFEGCTGLLSVDVPRSVVRIGDRVFAGCSSLLSVSYRCLALEVGGSDIYVGTPGDLVTKVYRMSHGWDGTNTEPCSLPPTWPNGNNGRAMDYLPIVITYDPCGGMFVIPEKKPTRQKHGTLPKPTRVGYYTFIGWFTDPEGGSLVTAESIVPDDHTTLYAHWDARRWLYTIVDGQAVIGSSTSTYLVVYPSTAERLVIPDYLEGCPVVSLEQYSLRSMSYTTEIILPQTVTNIGNYAFALCRSLTNVVWSANIETVGIAAFVGCYSLAEVELPTSLRSISANCFSSCTNLRRIVLGDSVTNVARRAFYNCMNLREVEVGANCIALGDEVFNGCQSLTNVTFKGNAPEVVGVGIYTNTPTDMVTFVPEGSTGWGGIQDDASLPSSWPLLDLNARAIRHVVVDNPIPALVDPTADEVVKVMEKATDQGLAQNITDKDTYTAFREWSMKVKKYGTDDLASATEVMSAKHAWLSFAIASEMLITNSVSADNIRVESFKPTSETGKFDFTVSVDKIQIGSDAAKENLKKVFGLEGAATLDSAAFSPNNVDIEFGTPVDGKVKFTAGPNSENANNKTFFMKVKMLP